MWPYLETGSLQMELGSGSTRENILDFSGDSNLVPGVLTGGGRGEGSERGAAL